MPLLLFQVDPLQAESMGLLKQQMKRVSLVYTPSDAMSQTLSNLHNQVQRRGGGREGRGRGVRLRGAGADKAGLGLLLDCYMRGE